MDIFFFGGFHKCLCENRLCERFAAGEGQAAVGLGVERSVSEDFGHHIVNGDGSADFFQSAGGTDANAGETLLAK